jgi:hypothetical protein
VELEKGMTAEMKEEVKELAQQLKAAQDRPQPVDKLPTLLVVRTWRLSVGFRVASTRQHAIAR